MLISALDELIIDLNAAVRAEHEDLQADGGLGRGVIVLLPAYQACIKTASPGSFKLTRCRFPADVS